MTTPLEFEVLTLFPALVDAFVQAGLIGKATREGHLHIHATDIREFTDDRHRTVDDTPFGGGPGMVLKIEPVVRAIEAVEAARGRAHKILLTPSAPRFDQRKAASLCARHDRILLVCGRYEGVDDRVREHFVDECLSVGDFVLNGGEVAALAVVEAVGRLREGVLGNEDSLVDETFGAGLLEHPHYTRPAVFRGLSVPEVLLGGDHEAIARFRRRESCRRTWAVRPDLRVRPELPRGHKMAVFLGDESEIGNVVRKLRKVWQRPVALLGIEAEGPTPLPIHVAIDALGPDLPGLLFARTSPAIESRLAARVVIPGLPLANGAGLIDISQPRGRKDAHPCADAVLAALSAEGLLP